MPIDTINNLEQGLSIRTKLNSVITKINGIAEGATSFDPTNPGEIGGGTPNIGNFTKLSMTQGVLTDPTPAISISATWNDAADTFHLDDADVTDTTSGANSTLLRRRVGGIDMFRIQKNGRVYNRSGIFEAEFGYQFYSYGTSVLQVDAGLGVLASASFPIRVNDPDYFGWYNGGSGQSDLRLYRAAAATLQLGPTNATTPTAQRIQAHNVTTGTGADLTLGGGIGSVTNGDVILDGGNRATYSAADFTVAPSLTRSLVSHGLMQIAPPTGEVPAPDVNAIALSWTDEETSLATRYRLEISLDDISYNFVDFVNPGTSSYAFISLDPNTVYYLRVRAEVGNNVSEWATVASGTLPDE